MIADAILAIVGLVEMCLRTVVALVACFTLLPLQWVSGQNVELQNLLIPYAWRIIERRRT